MKFPGPKTLSALVLVGLCVPGWARTQTSAAQRAAARRHRVAEAAAAARAEAKSLSVIASEGKDLIARARARKLKPHEYQGGTSSVSNLGMYGIKEFTAVINPPQSTILAVGTGEERAVVRNGQIVAAHIMSVTLSCDHRSVDGALGAELVSAFKRLIENPVMMVV